MPTRLNHSFTASQRINNQQDQDLIMAFAQTTLFTLTLFLLACLSTAPEVAANTPAPTKVWTVQQAVHFAITNSPDSRMTKQRIDAAQAMVRQARAAFYPRLGIRLPVQSDQHPHVLFREHS